MRRVGTWLKEPILTLHFGRACMSFRVSLEEAGLIAGQLEERLAGLKQSREKAGEDAQGKAQEEKKDDKEGEEGPERSAICVEWLLARAGNTLRRWWVVRWACCMAACHTCYRMKTGRSARRIASRRGWTTPASDPSIVISKTLNAPVMSA